MEKELSFEKSTRLPTGRKNLSYSEFKDWHECAFRHKLKYIDKIDLRIENEFSSFGKVIHDACQKFIETRKMDVDDAFNKLKDEWEEQFYEDFDGWGKALKDILNSIPSFLEKEFPNWKCFNAEEKLNENVDELNVEFVGYVDAVIEVVNKNGETEYIILDWKTSTYGWNMRKRNQFIIKAQLAFYKKLWAKKHNISLDKIKCGFILLKRLNDDNKCELVMMGGGDKTIKGGIKGLKNMVYSITNDVYIKNRMNCEYCEYKKTEFCPSQKLSW